MAAQTGQKIFCPYDEQYDGDKMTYNPDIHHRRSSRLKDYDYSQAGAYFVTICAQNRECFFGEIIDGEMRLNEIGAVAKQCWNYISQHFPETVLDEYIVMPNHIHGIVILNVGAKNLSPILHVSHIPHNDNSCMAKNVLPLRGTSMTIGSVVRGFKIGVTKWARENHVAHGLWQRNYYEHIIRNEPELHKIREYIINNPLNWKDDENYKD